VGVVDDVDSNGAPMRSRPGSPEAETYLAHERLNGYAVVSVWIVSQSTGSLSHESDSGRSDAGELFH